jgi:hypothetical protein
MYIRTVIGKIINVDEEVKLLNERPIKFRATRKTVTSFYKIKSQGDNLIDVLEEKDWISFGGVYFFEIESIYITVDTNIKKIRCRNTLNTTTENMTHYITHEQYMKLTQEVK